MSNDKDNSKIVRRDDAVEKALITSAQDLGHRLGNFHNYYSFHPPSNRLEHMGEILAYIRDTCARKRRATSSTTSEESKRESFSYCDLGCNQGDLTIEVSKALQETLLCPVEFTGMDIDVQLIERANEKWKDTKQVTGAFIAGNICADLETTLKDDSIDLISLLSTTMWVHIHVGDEGLKQLLRTLCRKTTRYLLLEPQPSKCYRNAMIRLRKMGRPELNVSSERLKWRPKLEQEMEATLKEHSFHRVELNKDGEGGDGAVKTSWNRSIQLYEKRTA